MFADKKVINQVMEQISLNKIILRVISVI